MHSFFRAIAVSIFCFVALVFQVRGEARHLPGGLNRASVTCQVAKQKLPVGRPVRAVETYGNVMAAAITISPVFQLYPACYTYFVNTAAKVLLILALPDQLIGNNQLTHHYPLHNFG